MNDLILIGNQSFPRLKKFLRDNMPELFDEITSISESNSFSIAQTTWHITRSDVDFTLGKCVGCGENTRFVSFKHGYKAYCSNACANKLTVQKRAESMKRRHGVPHAMQSEKIKEKAKQTCIEKYGVDNYAKSEEFLEQIQQSSMEKYGTEHHTQAEEVKSKILKGWRVKWGKSNIMHHPLIKAKYKKSMMDNHGCDKPQHIGLDSEVVEYMHLEQWWIDIFVHDGLTPKEIQEETGLSLSFIYKQLKLFKLIGEDQSIEHNETYDDDLFKPIF